jgi:ATP-dependent exoDNAse (exonuclease V) beta subunit
LFPEVRVVEASAGSGKTYALARRYVQLLLGPRPAETAAFPIRHILAITFTNKAAFEMKARILEFLKMIALGCLTGAQQDDLLGPVGLITETARPRAFAAMDALIRHYNFFQVQTIDKFINSLLAGCAFKIGLTANFKIRTDSRDYLQYSLDQLIDRAPADQDARLGFDRFLHNYLYLENRTGWFPRDDMMEIICTLYQQASAHGRPLRSGPVSFGDVVKDKARILADIRALREILPDGAHAGFRKSLDNFLTARRKGFDIDSVPDYFAREELPARKGVEVSPDAARLWGRINRDLRALCEDEAVGLFNPYIDIYRRILAGFQELSSRDDVLFLEQLNCRAAALFDDDGVTVEELYYRLATRYRHYLIDEFQDTSRLQWRNLEKMAEEALSTGGTLFYVGDRKQAIYGFRGGDAALFDRIKDDFSAFNVRVEPLTNNWRSERAIVEFNNAVFSPDNLRRFLDLKLAREREKGKKNYVEFSDGDIRQLESIFQSARQTFRPGHDQGYVNIEHVDAAGKDERDGRVRVRVLEIIDGLKGRFACRDIAVLTRSNAQVELLTNWLMEAGVPVESERTSNIKVHPLIRELTALLRFLRSPVDNIAFAAVLTGDLFTRASGLAPDDMHDFIFRRRGRRRDDKEGYLYMEFRAAYPDAWKQWLEPFFKNVGHYPLYEMVVSVYHRWGCLELFPSAQGFFMHFLELIKGAEEEHGDIGAFLDYFDALEGPALYAHMTGQDAVRVLTIHKSKGLEFPVVIVPFLGIDIQAGVTSSDNKQAYVLEDDGREIGLLRLKDKYYRYSDKLYGVYRRHYIQALWSELNTVYVALTRPQKELYALVPPKVKNSFNLVKLLLPENFSTSGTPSARAPEPGEVLDETRLLPAARYHDWLEYLNEEFLDAGVLKNRDQRLRGEILHYCLAQIERFTEHDLSDVVSRAAGRARARFPRVDGWEEHERRLAAVLGCPEIRRFFTAAGAVVKNEQEIVNRQGRGLRPDRVMVTEKEVLVIDYKSSFDEAGRAAGQVKEYLGVVRELYPGHRVKGFLVYFDTLTVEEV